MAREDGIRKPVILVSPDMRASVMGVAKSLIRENLLDRFVTTIAVNSSNGSRRSSGIKKIFHDRLSGLARTRNIPAYLDIPVETFPLGEATRIAATRIGFSDILCSHVWAWSETRFDRKVAEKWAGKA